MWHPPAHWPNPSPLPASSALLKSNLVWSSTIPGAQALCVGDWESDGSARVLVAAALALHVLDLTGVEKATLPLPDDSPPIECGRNKASGARLLGYTLGEASVGHRSCRQIAWSQSAGMGRGRRALGRFERRRQRDDMIVGMNGFSGWKRCPATARSFGPPAWQCLEPGHRSGGGPIVRRWCWPPTPAVRSTYLMQPATVKMPCAPEGGYYTGITAGVAESNSVQISRSAATPLWLRSVRKG